MGQLWHPDGRNGVRQDQSIALHTTPPFTCIGIHSSHYDHTAAPLAVPIDSISISIFSFHHGSGMHIILSELHPSAR